MKDRRPTLRGKLLRYLLVPLGVLSLFSAVATILISRNYANVAYDRALQDSLETVEEQVQVRNGKTYLDLPEVAWNILGFDSDDKVYFDIRRVDGTVLAGDADIPDPAPDRAKPGQAIFDDGTVHDQAVRIASMYVRPKGAANDETVLVQVAETLNKRHRISREILSKVLIPQLILILLTILSVWVGVTRSLVPLERLRSAIRNRSHQDLSPIPVDPVPREVLPLLRAINALMQQLNQVLTAQRHFIADAAHQLRTPLAGLTTQTELALRQTDPASLKHSLGQIRVGVERASHLVQQLLSLARAEAVPGSLVLEPVDLDDLARTVTAEWVPRAVQKDIDLGYEGPSRSIEVRGHALLLGEMLANVLDNAIRYTPDGGKITVHLTPGDHPRLTIDDSGPGIPPAERERVFERFHRLEENGVAGSGLGLAIVREIARSHDARVWLEDAAPSGGLRVNIEFRGDSGS